MSLSQSIFFTFFILGSILIMLFLTHLHIRILFYNKISEMLIHITRSHLIFISVTGIFIYFFLKLVSLRVFLICELVLYFLNLLSALVFFIMRRKRRGFTCLDNFKSDKSENNLGTEKKYILSEEDKNEIIKVFKNSHFTK
jgi:hypothetical protein